MIPRSPPGSRAISPSAGAWRPAGRRTPSPIVRNASVISASIEDWERMLRIDLTGVFLVPRFALNGMVKAGRGGSGVHVSSVAGIVADPNLAPYNAAKGGVHLLTKSMALDSAPHGIPV